MTKRGAFKIVMTIIILTIDVFIVQGLWNTLIPGILGLPKLTFLDAGALLFLVSTLLSAPQVGKNVSDEIDKSEVK